MLTKLKTKHYMQSAVLEKNKSDIYPDVHSGPLRAKMGPGVEVIMRPPPRETRLRFEVVSFTRSPLPPSRRAWGPPDLTGPGQASPYPPLDGPAVHYKERLR
jgi:hypothetical protein